MLELWNTFCLTTLDFLLGWTLRLPWDLTLVLVAVITAAVMTFTRVFTTNQDLLRRCAADLKQLNARIRTAKSQGDKATVVRLRGVKSMISMTKLKAEGLPLLVSLLPIAMLATWAFARLEFHPPQPQQPLELVVYTPASATGELIHLLPTPQLAAPQGWVRCVEAAIEQTPPHGQATFLIQPAALASGPVDLTLKLRLGDRTVERHLRLGDRTYPAPVESAPDGTLTTQWKLRQAKLFNVVPGLDAIMLSPWLVGYLIVVIPFVLLLKKVTRIY